MQPGQSGSSRKPDKNRLARKRNVCFCPVFSALQAAEHKAPPRGYTGFFSCREEKMLVT